MPSRAYVYYRVDAAERDDCVRALRELQAGWRRRWPGLRMELLQRPETDDAGRVTLMEAYDGAGLDEALPALEAEASRHLSGWLRSPRRCERFEPCA